MALSDIFVDALDVGVIHMALSCVNITVLAAEQDCCIIYSPDQRFARFLPAASMPSGVADPFTSVNT